MFSICFRLKLPCINGSGPAGLPLGPRDDPDRTLASRLQPGLFGARNEDGESYLEDHPI